MFRFHETNRKRVCRAAFAVLCVAPTLAMLAWIGWRCRSSLAEDESALLSTVLHLEARLANWREPRPGLVRTDLITLMRPDGDGALIELAILETQEVRGALRIEAGAVSLDADSLETLTQRAVTWLDSREQNPLSFTASDVALARRGVKDALVLHQFQISVESGPGSRKAQITAKVGVAADAKKVKVTVERTQDGIVSTLDLSEVELPCWLVASAIPALASLNEEATFSGVLNLEFRDGKLFGTARGQVANATLQSMLPLRSPHGARGFVTVSQLDLHWQGQRFESLAGCVRANDVELSASLVDAAVRSLYCKLATMQSPSDVIAVDQLACHFQFNQKGLTLTGELGTESQLPQGCLASSHGLMQLMQPAYVDLPLAAWVQFVAAPAASWFPATQEAVEIAERLPLTTR